MFIGPHVLNYIAPAERLLGWGLFFSVSLRTISIRLLRS